MGCGSCRVLMQGTERAGQDKLVGQGQAARGWAQCCASSPDADRRGRFAARYTLPTHQLKSLPCRYAAKSSQRIGADRSTERMPLTRPPGPLRMPALDARTQLSAPVCPLQLVAVYGSWHLGQLQVGLARAVRLGQGREVTITTSAHLPMQASQDWVLALGYRPQPPRPPFPGPAKAPLTSPSPLCRPACLPASMRCRSTANPLCRPLPPCPSSGGTRAWCCAGCRASRWAA